MPELGIFAVRDVKSDSMRFFFHPTIPSAVRTFETLATDPSSDVGRYPEDFQLYHVGFADETNGHVRPLETINFVANASDFVKKPAAQFSGAEDSSSHFSPGPPSRLEKERYVHPKQPSNALAAGPR